MEKLFICNKRQWFFEQLFSLDDKQATAIVTEIDKCKKFETWESAVEMCIFLNNNDPIGMYDDKWEVREYEVTQV